MEQQIKTFESLQYLIRYPDSYREGQRYPVILELHGAGSRGRDMEKLQNGSFLQLTAQIPDFPFICVLPQCHEDTWFDLFETLIRFAKAVWSAPFTDRERLYVMGASMGGYGTWQLCMSIPELVAAAVPVCGGGMYWNAGRLRNVPVWAFHGQKDHIVSVEESRKMAAAMKKSGGDIRLTIYPENTHDAWTDTFSNPEVYQWLLQHRNTNAADLPEKLDGADLYG